VSLHWKYFLTLLCGRIAPDGRCKKSELEEHITRACIPDAAEIKALERLCESLDAGVRNRRFTVLEGSANAFAAAPAETLIGDLLCVLTGCSVPVVLRKSQDPDEYHFVSVIFTASWMAKQ
jgi:hypothetical protein